MQPWYKIFYEYLNKLQWNLYFSKTFLFYLRCWEDNSPPLIRPLPTMATSLIRPDFRFTEIVKCYLIDSIKRGHPSYKVTVLLQNGDLITGGGKFQLFNKPDHKKTNRRILDLKGLVMYYHPDHSHPPPVFVAYMYIWNIRFLFF